MKSLFPVICSSKLAESKTFYESLLGLTTAFEIDWYIQMLSPTDANLQIAFVARDHESVPSEYSLKPQGIIVTIEMDDVEPVYQRAQSCKLPIVLALKDEPWGQRHFMTRDPNDLLVDLVQMIEPSKEFKEHFE